MDRSFTFDITSKRLEKINEIVDSHKKYPNTSNFINSAIDLQFKEIENKRIIEFLNYICLPLFFFVICIGVTLFTSSLFFYILTGIGGIYLMVFIFLFWNKYKIRG